MCGINGFNFKNTNLIKKMLKLTSNRGPDYQNFFENKKFSLGHNRLSIIDPNPRSHQPYKYKNYVLSFNGEIFNYKELKKKLILNGYKFETESDTEVIIKYFDYKGVKSFQDLSGIFSISLYDSYLDKLYLIRDIIGVKPLYYFYDSNNKKFVYSSLIKSILLSVENKQLNLSSINSYSNFNRNDYRETFYKNIFKVLPGELIEFSNNSYTRSKLLNFEFSKDYNVNLKKDISDTFSNQFLSDVPIALSLSGGVDSNIILYELLKNKDIKFQNYSVTFQDFKKYQIDHDIAKKISNYYGVKFNSVEVRSSDFEDNAEEIVDIVEEPVGNTNSIANYVLSKNINEKVLLSGDGGDEIFTGYDKYRSIYILSILNKFNPFKNLKINHKNKILNRLFINNSRKYFLSFSEQNLFKNAHLVYKNFELFKDFSLDKILNHSLNIDNKPNLSNVMYHDLDTWVPNDILNRNDKIYGNQGIEVRVPFLDKNIIQNYLMINSFNKYGFSFKNKNLLLKNYSKVNDLIVKKKLGFNSPFTKWLKKEIFTFGQKILSKDYYNSSHILDIEKCQKILYKHQKTYCDPYLIWNLISLQIFLRKNKF